MLATTLRWEIVGEPIRVLEIAPGAVAPMSSRSSASTVTRERAAAVYDGYQPLLADDIADAIAWTLSRPSHVNIDLLVVRPRAQASNTKIARTSA